MKKNKCLICHYAEIGIKGKNRRYFENQLVSNIKEALPEAQVLNLRNRIIVFPKEEREAIEKLKKICGIAYFSPATVVPTLWEEIEKKVVLLMKKRSFETFRITVKRSHKAFPLSSKEIAARLGSSVGKATQCNVDLSSPEVNCRVEITKEETYIYFEKIKGVGGLPVGAGGRVVSLLSGGIDSPVASFRLIRRGAKNVFIHFHAYPVTSSASIEKVRKIIRVLSSFQGEAKIYMVPFADTQKEIMLNIKESLRVIFYRRFMMRIAREIARKEKAGAIVTGESLGQVASQTIENMRATSQAIDIPVFRPLLGYDKEEIISEAKRIETYETSILPEEDCCVRFLPRHPEIKADLVSVEKEEEKLDVNRIIKEALEKSSCEIV